MASVARSGLPDFVTTPVTSGNSFRTRSTSRPDFTDSVNEMLGSLRVSINIDPSSRRGMNSVPMKKSETNALDTIAVAITVTTTG